MVHPYHLFYVLNYHCFTINVSLFYFIFTLFLPPYFLLSSYTTYFLSIMIIIMLIIIIIIIIMVVIIIIIICSSFCFSYNNNKYRLYTKVKVSMGFIITK